MKTSKTGKTSKISRLAKLAKAVSLNRVDEEAWRKKDHRHCPAVAAGRNGGDCYIVRVVTHNPG